MVTPCRPGEMCTTMIVSVIAGPAGDRDQVRGRHVPRRLERWQGRPQGDHAADRGLLASLGHRLHRPVLAAQLGRHTPLQETISTLNDLVRAGKIRYVGLSDTPAWAVARAATIGELRGWAQVASTQVEYSLPRRTVEGELFCAARELGLGLATAHLPITRQRRCPDPDRRDGPSRPRAEAVPDPAQSLMS
jgi:hypothetical protein